MGQFSVLSKTQSSEMWIFMCYYLAIIIEWGRVGYEEFCRSKWITPSEICRILHILQMPNSIIALLFIQNIFFAQTSKLYSRPFPSSSLLNDTTLCPGFLGQWFNNLWRQWFIICSGLHFGRRLTSMVHKSAADCTFDVIGSIWQNS